MGEDDFFEEPHEVGGSVHTGCDLESHDACCDAQGCTVGGSWV